MSRSTKSVAARRRARGIRIFDPKKHHWTPADDKLLGERPDSQVALFLGISRIAVLHRRCRLRLLRPGAEKYARPRPWPPEEDALLGTALDAELADKLRRTLSDVSRRRHRLGIPSHGHHWTPKTDALLGKLPDKKVARRLRCTVKAVARRRERLEIPAAR